MPRCLVPGKNPEQRGFEMSGAPIRKQLVRAAISLSLAILPAAAFSQEVLSAGPRPSLNVAKDEPGSHVLPDAPSTLRNSTNVGHLDRKGNLVYPNDRPRKLFTKPFLAAHAVFLASTVFDIEVTHQGLAHHMCVEQNGSSPRPSRGDLYKIHLLEFAAFTGMDTLFQAAHFKGAPYVGAIVGTIKHVNGGTRWVTGCW
jgi:hypothetical protein